MSDELNPAIIKRTQDILGKYVKKPTLTEKLLKKPPFRFLYDVFSVIIRDTKCFVGLYTLEELTYDNIKDRDDKMKFLQKMIDVVKLTTGSSLAIKTSKIVAGNEPEKTNELLQLMGEIIEKKLDWQTAVEQVLSGKTERKEPSRKSKNSITPKMSKDVKSKDKYKEHSKEKELKPKEQKAAKVIASKGATANKNEKIKASKTKDNSTRQSTQSSLKGTKQSEKTTKNSVKESNVKLKLKNSESQSQSSNKSSPSPKTLDPQKELKSMQNDIECEHKETGQQLENTKIATSPAKLQNSSLTGELLNSKASIDSIQVNDLEGGGLSGENSKKSSASLRKSGAGKSAQVLGEQVEGQENKTNFETAKLDKSEISETGLMASPKQNDFATITHNEQQQVSNHSDSDDFNKNPRGPPLSSSQEPPSSQKSVRKPPQQSPPASLHSEMKRESTFTRENSIDSNKSSIGNRPRTSLRPPSARPPSARPGAPRRRDKNIEIILQPNDQIKMSGIQVKLETFGDLDDDGENLVIIENPNATDIANEHQSNLNEREKTLDDQAIGQGHLVQQILETQKELVQQQNDAGVRQENDNKESTNNSVMRQTSARQMNNLRDVIQNITKSVNPLGKLMDFIPEDVDAMQLEFTLWRDLYTQAASELKREKNVTESATEPLKNQLVQIEANIVEYVDMINASRAKILQNSEKILKMFTTT